MIDPPRVEDRVRISGVAQRIEEQAADPCLVVRGPTNICDTRAVSIIVVRSRVVRVDATRAKRVIELSDFAVAREGFPKRVVGTAFFAHRNARRTASLFREYLNDAGKCAGTVDRTLWAARDFDSVDVVGRQIREIELAGESLIDRDSIEQALHFLARQSAHENRRDLSRRSG